jgi:hypothetical protein
MRLPRKCRAGNTARRADRTARVARTPPYRVRSRGLSSETCTGLQLHTTRYANVIKSVRLSVDAFGFNGSFVALALFWLRIWYLPMTIS